MALSKQSTTLVEKEISDLKISLEIARETRSRYQKNLDEVNRDIAGYEAKLVTLRKDLNVMQVVSEA